MYSTTLDSDSSAGSGGLSFTGLYDKETEMGDSSVHEEEDTTKKTRVPVIICIICAIICIIATLLILFVIPSKYNLKNKKNKNETKTEVVTNNEPENNIDKTVEETKPVEETVPQSKEDEVIVIEEAEKVIPLPPPAVEEKKPADITYKIKWGDTLWDIADTYYKNPWRYHKIAKYNNIKNPDYIISGTTIKIPAE